jgi:hypothetical protein
MLQSVSWKQYFVCILIATFLYYLFVWIVFFKARLALLPGISNFRQISLHGDDQADEVLTTAQHITDELRPLFTDRTTKNELLLSLNSKLKRYAEWEEPGFRKVINEFIAVECEVKCSIHLSERDIAEVWTR